MGSTIGATMRFLAMVMLAGLMPMTAEAAQVCDRAGGETVFYCKIKGSGHEVSACDLKNGTFLYVYGRAGKPELELRRGRDELVYQDWNGVGFRFWATLAFENDGYHYRMFFDADKDLIARDGMEAIVGGVDIFAPGTSPVDGDPVARKECRPETIEPELMGLDIPVRD